MKIKDLRRRISSYKDDVEVFFEIEGKTIDGEATTYPMSLKQVYYSGNKQITLRFEDA